MPNIPKPLHRVNPRIIMGEYAWTKARKKAYFDAKYRSEISGELCATPGSLHAHEVYDINYVTGTCVFRRICAITPLEHVYFIHSGRMLTLWKNKNPLYPTEKVLEGLENGFKLIYKWNKEHPRKPKLKVYETILEYLDYDELAEPVEKLIDKYEIEFWGEDRKRRCDWEDWKLVIVKEDGTKEEHYTPYANQEEWEKAMVEANKADNVRKAENPFVGGAFDEVDKLLSESTEEEEKKVILISDIDGVLADCTHRLPYLKKKDYESFYSDAETSKDLPIKSGLDLVKSLMKMAKETIFVTGRRESCRISTVNWLGDNDIRGFRMICRKDQDWRPSQVVKKEVVGELLENVPADAEIFYIDDKPENVRAVCTLPYNITGLTFVKTNGKKEECLPWTI